MGTVPLPLPRVRPAAGEVDAAALAAALRAAVRGEVRFTTGDRALYATDASNYRQVPIGVVIPLDIEDAVAAIGVCRDFGAPVLSRGGGTSLGGQCTNTAVVIDWTKHVNAVESVDEAARTAIVQPGIVLDEVNKATREHGGLVFGPKPATHDHCTIGGMIGNNSCGSTAQWSGTTAANVRRLEILTYDGARFWVGPTGVDDLAAIERDGGRRAEIYRSLAELAQRHGDEIRARFPDIPRRISGYNLPALLPEQGVNVAQALVGSESTCVTILRAELALLPEPEHVVLVLAGYDDIATAADHVPAVNKLKPYIVEGLDNKLIEYEKERRLNTVALQDLPAAGAWLMVKVFGDDDAAAKLKADALLATLVKDGDLVSSKIFDDPAHQAELDSVREAALGATARVPGMPDTWPGWEDSAVPPEKVGDYLRELQKLLDEFGYGAASLYGHFGDGCVHTSIPFDLVTANGIADFRSFVTRAAHLVVSFGGSLSGEHGDGQARGELLPIMYGDALTAAFAEFKAIFDPAGKMNPGKVVDPNPLDGQLRLGTGWTPPVLETAFDYPSDGGFAGVPTRCFGVGACRRHESDEGVMCPSYMVTREEKHSTRGRMRLLFEMMRGETITDGWRSKEVHEALDLCLACKGCKTDCPVNVDMATYKVEFLSHHYKRRLRPRVHYSLGWLPLWARIAAKVPWLANFATQTPGLRSVAKFAAGVDQQRDVPKFARKRFTDAFRGRTRGAAPPSRWPAAGAPDRGTVVLWPDTFTNSLSPHVATAAVTVLEAAGFTVIVPTATVCCGLTWISTGQLDTAKKVLRRSLDVLKPYLDAGYPIVGLEPSCTSVLRADGVDLLGGDLDAKRLKDQTVTLAELLRDKAPDFAPTLVGADGGRPKAVIQTHCHQHAVMGFQADTEVMKRVGIEPEVLKSGCCGLAGDFGMVREHRDVSLACAERVLLPAVRDADPTTIVLADGFSCRTQIAGARTGRTALHLAEVLAAAVAGQRVGDHPERDLGGRP